MTTVRLDDLRQWPTVVPLWPEAASAFGLGRSAAYELVRRGQFPCRVLRLGRQMRVPTADVLAALGVPLTFSNNEAPDACEAETGAAVAHALTFNPQEAGRAGAA